MSTIDDELLKAVKAENIDSTIALLERGASLEKFGTEFISFICGNYKVSSEFVAALLPHIALDDAKSCLMKAIFPANYALVDTLLEFGINPNFHQKQGESPLLRAAGTAYHKITQSLLNHGADANYTPMDARNTPLGKACEHGHLPNIRLLLKHGANVNAVVEHEQSMPPLVAAAGHNREQVQLLLDHGADIDIQNPIIKQTPLMKAASRGSEDIIRLFLNYNTDIERRDATGRSALMYGINARKLKMVEILLEHGSSLHPLPGDYTPALIRVSALNFDLVFTKLLCSHGAEVDIVDVTGSSALIRAARNSNLGLTKYLLEQGADTSFVDENNKSALIYAEENDDQAIIELLRGYRDGEGDSLKICDIPTPVETFCPDIPLRLSMADVTFPTLPSDTPIAVVPESIDDALIGSAAFTARLWEWLESMPAESLKYILPIVMLLMTWYFWPRSEGRDTNDGDEVLALPALDLTETDSILIETAHEALNLWEHVFSELVTPPTFFQLFPIRTRDIGDFERVEGLRPSGSASCSYLFSEVATQKHFYVKAEVLDGPVSWDNNEIDRLAPYAIENGIWKEIMAARINQYFGIVTPEMAVMHLPITGVPIVRDNILSPHLLASWLEGFTTIGKVITPDDRAYDTTQFHRDNIKHALLSFFNLAHIPEDRVDIRGLGSILCIAKIINDIDAFSPGGGNVMVKMIQVEERIVFLFAKIDPGWAFNLAETTEPRAIRLQTTGENLPTSYLQFDDLHPDVQAEFIGTLALVSKEVENNPDLFRTLFNDVPTHIRDKLTPCLDDIDNGIHQRLNGMLETFSDELQNEHRLVPYNEWFNAARGYQRRQKRHKAAELLADFYLEPDSIDETATILGEGGQGIVSLGRWETQDIAIKKLKSDFHELDNIQFEAAVLCQLRHQIL